MTNEPRISPLTALLMAPGLAATYAQAADAPAENVPGTNAPTQLPAVTVRGQQDSYKPDAVASPKYTEPLRDIPKTITVVPRAVMEDQGATSLRDALRNIPGISIQAGEGGGGLPGDNLAIRGFNSRSDIFVDGIRDFGSYGRDIFNVEQIEVSKGPTSTTIGRGSAGGAINLITRRPQLNPSYGGNLGFGTADYKRTTLDVNQPLSVAGLDTSAVRLNALWHDAGVPGRDVVEDSRWAVNPALAFGLGTPTRLFLDYLHMEQDNVPEYGIPWVPTGNTNAVLSRYINKAPPVDFSNFYGLKDYDFEDICVNMVTVTFEHDFNEAVSLRNVSRYQDSYRNHAITAPRFADLDPTMAGNQSNRTLNRQLQRREIENRMFANATDATFEFETGPVGHALVAGLELSREEQDNRNSAQNTNQPQTDIFNPNHNDRPFGPMPPLTGTPNEATAVTVAPYVFETLKLGEHWQLNGGVRWDHVESDYDPGASRSLSRTDDLVSWQAGIVFKPRPNGSIYFGYGTSFSPSIEAGNTGLSLSTNNVALNPEETRTFELGTKWDLFGERLSLTAAAFHTEKINARTSGLNPGDPPLVLDGEQVVRGIELSVAGNITENWQVFAGYAYLETEIEESNTSTEVGAEFGNTPEHSFSFWSTYRIADVQLGAGAQYVGDRFNNQSGNANVRTAPDYWLFDAMLAYEINDNVSLQLNVYNLADERYIDRVGGGHFIPGPGRSAVLSANLRF